MGVFQFKAGKGLAAGSSIKGGTPALKGWEAAGVASPFLESDRSADAPVMDASKLAQDTALSGAGKPLASAATGSVSKVYQHWADGDAASGSSADWNNNILSDNKSDYFEGEVIPHVYFYQASNKAPLVQGQSYTFEVTYNYYQANTNAGGFLNMTTFNQDRSPGVLQNGATPTADAGGYTNGGGMNGTFYTVNADVTAVSGVTYVGSGTQDAKVLVTFTYTGQTTASGQAAICYGLMIAGPGDVPDQGQGMTHGASEWTGGSLQTTVSVNGSGATSIQLSPSAIIPGEISGYKFDDADGDGVWDTGESGLSGWTVFLDSNGNGALDSGETSTVTRADDLSTAGVNEAGAYSFSVTPDADRSDPDNDPYIVREVQQAGWMQTTANPAPITITSLSPTAENVNFGNLKLMPKLEIDKMFIEVTGGNGNALADFAGDVLNYKVKVTNSGNLTLTNVTVKDPLTGQDISGVTLAPGESQTYDTQYVLKQSDLDTNGGGDGDVDNTATADSDQTEPTSDSEQVPVVQDPRIAIDKMFIEVTGGDGDALADFAGDVLNYKVKVTNSGNQTLTNVTVKDPLTGQDISGVTLAPGESQTYDTQYVLQQSDLDTNGGGDGDVDNTATADSDQTEPTSDSEQVPVVQDPRIAIDKMFIEVTGGNGNALADFAGDVLNYKVKVTNSGNLTLTNVTVKDPLTGQDISGVTLAPGESQTYDTQYVLQQSDLDTNGGGDGDVDNTATADSDQTGPVDDSEQVMLVQDPRIAIDKLFIEVTGGNGNALADFAGDVLNYKVKVTNSGNLTLTNVTVKDPLTGQDISGVTLAPGESQTYDTQYVLQQSDLDTNGGGDGDVDNTATADSDQTEPTSDSEQVPVVQRPAMVIEKTFLNVTGGDGDSMADFPGDVLNYVVSVTNTGNLTLTNVQIEDPLTGQLVEGITLKPGEVQSFTASYTLQQADLDTNGGGDGDVDNTAYAHSDQTSEIEASATAPLQIRPYVSLNKVVLKIDGGNGNALADAAGDVIHYQAVVKNVGNKTVTQLHVTDPLTGLDETVPSLAPGESLTFTSTYTLTQTDLDENGGGDGDIDNVATVWSDQTRPVSDAETVTLVRNVALFVDKFFIKIDGGNGNTIADAPGDVLHYGVTVANPGNVTQTQVEVNDPLTGESYLLESLDPGETYTEFGTYTLTQTDLDQNGNPAGSGAILNTAYATSDQTSIVEDMERVPILRSAAMGFDKQFVGVSGGNGNDLADEAGDVLTYLFKVSNLGNVTLTDVELVDPMTGTMFSGIELDPGEEREFVGVHVLTQDDLDDNALSGLLDNTGYASSSETPVVEDAELAPLYIDPMINLTKYVSVNGGSTWFDANTPNGPLLVDNGTAPLFKFLVQNTGNLTLQDILLSDSSLDLNGGEAGDDWLIDTLAPKESYELMVAGAYEAGAHDNTGTVTVTIVGLETLTDSDTAHYLGV